jgi:hypothetical protein
MWIKLSIIILGLLATVACVDQSTGPGGHSSSSLQTAADGLPRLTKGSNGTRHALYGCFDGGTALRLDTTRNYVPNPWSIEKFRNGFCLALPKGSHVVRQERVPTNEGPIARIQLPGSTKWLYLPDWSIRADRSGALSRQHARFSPMIEVTRELLAYAEVHTICMRDILELNARVLAHNELFLEESKERRGEETITKTVIKLNPTPLDVRGQSLNREVAEYQTRCTPYKTLEAAEKFILFMRERASIDVLPSPSSRKTLS